MKKSGIISLAILIVITVSSVFAPVIARHDPCLIDLDSLREPPGLQHPLGTDNKGRDMLSRILHGGRISLGIALTAALFSMTIGLAIGLCSGYFGGMIDTALMALVDLVLSFPSLLLAIGISIIMPQGIYTVVIAIAAVGWASFARLIRGHVLVLREASYIEAAISIGCSRLRILFLHLMPQCIPILLVVTGMRMGGFILTEASLSFLGLGAQPPAATWGSMINANRAYLASAPWMVFSPGLMIAATALCFNVLGDSLRDLYDLRKKGQD
jgi:peptide/nickel transport system permease protein